jgi:hypothetical protein
VPYRYHCEAALLQHCVNPASFARDVFRFEPDATQTQVLESNPHRLILNCNRQWGKSTVSSILLSHRAIFSAGSLSVILGPSERQSAETLRKVAGYLNDAGVETATDKVNRRSIVLPANGSRIVALPSADARVRGFSQVSLLVIDEASRVPDPLYYALRPALAVCNGDIFIASTPFGKRGFFYNEFTSATENWTRVTVPASQCPRIPADFLERERLIGEEYFAQEYECQFVEDGRFLFSDADLQRLFKSDIQPIEVNRNDPAWNCVMKPVKSRFPGAPTEWPNIYARDE